MTELIVGAIIVGVIAYFMFKKRKNESTDTSERNINSDQKIEK